MSSRTCDRCGTQGVVRPIETWPHGVDRPMVLKYVCEEGCTSKQARQLSDAQAHTSEHRKVAT